MKDLFTGMLWRGVRTVFLALLFAALAGFAQPAPPSGLREIPQATMRMMEAINKTNKSFKTFEALEAAAQSNLVSAAVAPVLTNKPLVVEFDPVPPVWFTNVSQQIVTVGIVTNAGLVWETRSVSTPRFVFKPITNYLVTCTTGTNENLAITNRTGIITNRGPVTFSVSPTNKYTVILWGLQADKQMAFLSSQLFPLAPSNVVTFALLPITSPDPTRPEDQWQRGTNVILMTVTNVAGAGSNVFMRAIVRTTVDDFTPKAVRFDATTYRLLPAN